MPFNVAQTPKVQRMAKCRHQHHVEDMAERKRIGQEGMIKLRRLSQKLQEVTREKESGHER